MPISINMTLGESLGVLGLVNARPVLTEPPSESKYTVEVGEAWFIDLGETYDVDNDTVSVTLNCTNTNNTFLNLIGGAEGFYRLEIEKGTTTVNDVGRYDFDLVVADQVGNSTYTFNIKIATPDQIVSAEQIEKLNELLDNLRERQKQVIKLPPEVAIKKDAPPGKRLPMTPTEFIASLGDDIVIDPKDPMKSVDTFAEKEFEKGLKRDTSASRNDKPPDIRVKEITAEADVNFMFTSLMEFPDDIVSQLASDERRRLEGEIDEKAGLKIELAYFPGVEDPLKADIELAWELKNITNAGVAISITFDRPLEVSQDLEADFALITIEGFDRFKDGRGKSLPSKMVKRIALPA